MGAQRIKDLRKLQGLTQTDLAEKLGVSLSSVAMRETGKRTPWFKALNGLSNLFDKSIDYILGTSDDDHSVKLTESEQSQLGRWQMKDDCRKIIRDYMSLDKFGKAAVENLVQMEKLRCMNQQTIISKTEDK